MDRKDLMTPEDHLDVMYSCQLPSLQELARQTIYRELKSPEEYFILCINTADEPSVGFLQRLLLAKDMEQLIETDNSGNAMAVLDIIYLETMAGFTKEFREMLDEPLFEGQMLAVLIDKGAAVIAKISAPAISVQ